MFLLSAFFLGFFHSFEADHLMAVTNLVSTKQKDNKNYKTGLYWGFGHTFTIFVLAILVIFLKYVVNEEVFERLEILVGFMLIGIGVYKIIKFFRAEEKAISHTKSMATGMGIIHGIAGSGSVVILAMASTDHILNSILYLILFGVGSIFGMYLASFVLSTFLNAASKKIQQFLPYFSLFAAIVCFLLGVYIVYTNPINVFL